LENKNKTKEKHTKNNGNHFKTAHGGADSLMSGKEVYLVVVHLPFIHVITSHSTAKRQIQWWAHPHF